MEGHRRLGKGKKAGRSRVQCFIAEQRQFRNNLVFENRSSIRTYKIPEGFTVRDQILFGIDVVLRGH
ncbi:hypothetical protein FNV43_RR20773 [Rhamnella rubrinervis]|uniref:Uncharacterized protein n=1 Tax=Rhamnella rubrinervis TaxID=2594499 RepID=A0A8K0DV13_9ROSA|nr:hypothetical protein FNV43_RR20773 [Rhamnella rubrinervis]